MVISQKLFVASVFLGLASLPLAAQDNRPRTFAEEASPATFGTTVATGTDGRLLVSDLVAGSAAANAGLRTGDRIVSVDGRFITQTDDFNSYLAARPTATTRIIVLRDGAEQTIVVNGPPSSSAAAAVRPALGIRFPQGAQVNLVEVIDGSPADLAGLQAGDQLIELNDQVILSSDEFITRVGAADLDHPLKLTFLRDADRHLASILPAAWDSVFSTSGQYSALKPAASDTTVAPGAIGQCGAGYSPYGPYSYYSYPGYNPYFVSNVSPVVVPLAWNYPYWSGYWGYPYYGAYVGHFYNYYPTWYYTWPAGGYYYSGPYPGHPGRATPATKLESTQHAAADTQPAITQAEAVPSK